MALLCTVEGRKFKVRALLDQGSAVSFISQSLYQTMRTKHYRANLQVHCFGEQYGGVAKTRVALTLKSCNEPGSSFPMIAYVYQKITSYAGSRSQPVNSWPHLKNLTLADPDPFSSHPIHLLIGANLYRSLLKNKIIQGPLDAPTAQLTALGWILSGPTGNYEVATGSVHSLNCESDPRLSRLSSKGSGRSRKFRPHRRCRKKINGARSTLLRRINKPPTAVI